jgi:hypothetical protein
MQVFSKDWFKRHQSKLVKFANTRIGRYVFGIKSTDLITEISPSSRSVFKSYNPKTRTVGCQYIGFTNSIYAINLHKNLRYFWKTLHAIDSIALDHQTLVPNFGFATYQEESASGDVIGGDGQVRRLAGADSFATIRAGAGNGHTMSDTTMGILLTPSASTNTYSQMARSFVSFDTNVTALTHGAIKITDATLRLYCITKANWGLYVDDDDVGLSCVDPDLLTEGGPLVNGDYAQYTTTVYGTSGHSTFTTSANTDVTLNSTFIAAINSTGYTDIGLRLGGDTDNVTPNWMDTGGLYEGIYFSTAEGAGDAPRLTLTYSYPVSINIGDTWKSVSDIYINVGDSWKTLDELQINIGDVWKDII